LLGSRVTSTELQAGQAGRTVLENDTMRSY